MIHVDNLEKYYGDFQALRGVSFEVKEGEVVGLLGPNGAGKSTIIKTLTGYLQPDAGTVSVDGLDVLAETREVQSRIGYLPESTPLYTDQTVQSYLLMMAELRQISDDVLLERLSEAIYATGLQERLTQPIGELSKGFRQRVGLAQAILHRPRLLILDEPTVGLDPTQIVEIRTLIKRLAQHSTILFSSHILSEVEAVCDRVIIIMNGEVREDARLADLSATTDAILVLSEDYPGAAEALQNMAGVERVEITRNGRVTYRAIGNSNADLCPTIYDLARQHDWPVRELRPDVQTLETVFNKLATG